MRSIRKMEEEKKNQSQFTKDIVFEKREKNGKYELIFPFNKQTEELAVCLNKSGGASVSGPNYMKMLVQEIKKYELQYLEYMKTAYQCYS